MATEVIHTLKTSGGDYSSIDAWEADQQRDLVAADEIAVLECYSGEYDDNGTTIAGWTTDGTRYVEIRAASGQEHGGLASAGVRITSTSLRTFNLQNAARLIGLVLLPTNNKGGVASAGAGGTDIVLSGCVINGGGANQSTGIIIGNQTGDEWVINNNIVYGFDGVGGEGIVHNVTGTTAHIYNNTVVGNTRGIVQGAGTCRLKNNIVQDSTGNDFTGSFTDTEKNISSDATSPQVGLRNIDLAFEDADNDDYHLAANDSDARGAGVDLSADSNFAFSDDIDGQDRVTWDIGADEFGDETASNAAITALRRRRRAA